MGIIATYKDTNKTVKDAYIRVGRVWGSSREGWNCWVEVFEKEGDVKTAVPMFSVSAPYVDGQNPFEALYNAIELLPFIGSKVKETVADPVISVEEPKVVQEVKTKPLKVKKSAK